MAPAPVLLPLPVDWRRGHRHAPLGRTGGPRHAAHRGAHAARRGPRAVDEPRVGRPDSGGHRDAALTVPRPWEHPSGRDTDDGEAGRRGEGGVAAGGTARRRSSVPALWVARAGRRPALFTPAPRGAGRAGAPGAARAARCRRRRRRGPRRHALHDPRRRAGRTRPPRRRVQFRDAHLHRPRQSRGRRPAGLREPCDLSAPLQDARRRHRGPGSRDAGGVPRPVRFGADGPVDRRPVGTGSLFGRRTTSAWWG